MCLSYTAPGWREKIAPKSRWNFLLGAYTVIGKMLPRFKWIFAIQDMCCRVTHLIATKVVHRIAACSVYLFKMQSHANILWDDYHIMK